MLAKSAWVWVTCEHPLVGAGSSKDGHGGWSQVIHAPLERWLQRKLQFVNISTSLFQGRWLCYVLRDISACLVSSEVL